MEVLKNTKRSQKLKHEQNATAQAKIALYGFPFFFFWSDILNTRRSVLSHILTHRGKISNTGRSVLSDIQTPRSKISNTRGSVSSDIQTLGSDKKKTKRRKSSNTQSLASNIWNTGRSVLSDVTCFVRLHTLLHVVESYCAKFETVQTLSYVQTDATTPNNVGSSWPECCARLHGALA